MSSLAARARDVQRRTGCHGPPWIALGLAALGFASGCGTSAVGVDSCKQIEEARCRQAPACGISLEPPYHTSGNDVDACIRSYDIACLHGLDVADPGPTVVAACVAAIESSDACAAVSAPETAPACAWLVPSGSTTDAEATTDATSAADSE